MSAILNGPETYSITVGGVTRDLPFVRPTPNTRLPLVELLGDVELTRACALELQKLLPKETEALFTCETSSITLAHVLSELTGLPYEVARKRRRPYMDNPLIQEVASMTLGVNETLWLGTRQAARLKGKQVGIVLDVVASGGTMAALEKLVARAGGSICCEIAAFTQGKASVAVTSLQDLPTLNDK
jgi:adenine phosphoribosyltransferase